MLYSQFTLATVKKTFNLTTSEETDIFANGSKIPCSEYLAHL